MCGIAGFIGNDKISNEIINKSLFLMKNRGPDDQSFCHFKVNNSLNIYLLHSRLSIIDLKNRSNQPFKKKHITLIFNGEIYNYKEIRKNLEELGYKFYTESDTEVLASAYLQYGEKCVDYFEGMWAFALWDDKIKKLFLSRDRFGEKPLFFYKNQKGIYFGSEIKFIKSLSSDNFIINTDKINSNLLHGYKSIFQDNTSYFRNVLFLEAGHNFIIDSNLKKKKYKYWKPIIKQNKKLSYREACEGVNFYLKKSLKIRLRSDVPVAFCLSGGVDSSLLASIAVKEFNTKVSTYSIIDKDERYNEKKNILTTVNDLKCKSNLVYLNHDKTFFNLKKLVQYHDCPISTVSYLVHSFLSEKISKNKYKVAISGTGADELFTGYYHHYLLYLKVIKHNKNFNKQLSDWKKFVLPLVRNPNLKDLSLRNKNNNYEDINSIKKFVKKITKKNKEKKFKNTDLLRNKMLNELFYEVIPVILHHDDLNSMYYSIENRSPYLDKSLFEFASSIPTNFLINQGYQKNVLRDSFKNILNDQVRLDRHKKGFNASINTIIDFKDPRINNYLFDKNSEINDFVNMKEIKKEIYTNNSNQFSKFIFSVLNTKIFIDAFN
jgi:asparagine synthase (glutamine-hydrolysing)